MCISLAYEFSCVLFHAAGYEHIYEFADWIFGHGIGHTGVRMNILHWQQHMTNRYQDAKSTRAPFFGSSKKCRDYIQTGIACWSCSIPEVASDACCDYSNIGGDGTHIGVSARQVMPMSSIWMPEKHRESILKWGRSSRRPASFSLVKSENGDTIAILDPTAAAIGSAVSKACTLAVGVLRHHKDYAALSMTDVELGVACLPKEIRVEFMRWKAALTKTSSQYRPLQQLLLSAVSSESVSGAFPVTSISKMMEMLAHVQLLKANTQELRRVSMLKFLDTSREKFESHVMPLHAWNLVYSQVKSTTSDGGLLESTFELIQFLGV